MIPMRTKPTGCGRSSSRAGKTRRHHLVGESATVGKAQEASCHSPTRISRGASQREAVDGIDGVLREARWWSAKVIAAVGIIPVPLYFLGRNENVFPVLPALRIDLAVDRFDFGRVAVRIVATAERRIIRHVPRRIKPLMQRPILSGMVAMSGLVLLTFLRMDERCQQASAREEELAKKVQGAVSLLTTAKWCAISG